MATNLLIAHHDIARKGTFSTPLTQYKPYEAKNVTGGSKVNKYKAYTIFSSSLASNTTHLFKWDLGSGNDLSASFFYAGRADLTAKKNQSAVLQLSFSDDDSSYTEAVLFDTVYNELVGIRTEDLFATFAETSAHRYWRLKFGVTSGSVYPEISKIMFGNAFDLGVDPIYGYTIKKPIISENERVLKYQFNFRWEGVTDTILQEFTEEILNYKDVCSFVLYASQDTAILDSLDFINCKIVDFKMTPNNLNNNTIEISFEEII